MKIFFRSIRVLICLTLLLGLGYPLFVTYVAGKLMPWRANGSIMILRGEPRMSLLIAQEFASARYFHTRPSAVGYDGDSSGGSSLGPTSAKLILTNIPAAIRNARSEDGLPAGRPIPPDMVTSSASGLDPHISLSNATLQIPRVAKARHISESQLIKIVLNQKRPSFLGICGETVVNVMSLNLYLDESARETGYDK